MPLATFSQTNDALIATWQAMNGAKLCSRLCATITHATCEENQHHREHNCMGCGGLENQTPRPALVMIWDADKETDEPAEANFGFDAIDADDEEPVSNESPFVDEDDDLDDEQLLSLFPELARNDAPGFPRFSEHQEAVRPYPSYEGSCERCGTHG